MKLIFCTVCNDVAKLQDKRRYCWCGRSWGEYQKGGLYAVIGGEAVPLGIANPSFVRALVENSKKIHDTGVRFEAFVIPPSASTVKVDAAPIPSPDKGG